MSSLKRIACLVLACVLVSCVFPAATVEAAYTFTPVTTTSQVIARLSELASIQNGKYWNAGYGSVGNDSALINQIKSGDFSTCLTSKGCGSTCTSNCFDGRWQCNGFANYIAYVLSGKIRDESISGWYDYKLWDGKTFEKCTLQELRPGDVIYYNSGTYDHWVVVWYIEGSTLYVAEANINNTCLINYGPSVDSASHILSRIKRVSRCSKISGNNTSPTFSSSMSAEEYLGYVKVEPMNVTAVTKNNASYQTWKLPWTNNKDANLKLKTVSGKIKIINKIVNHADNIWYEYETGTSTRGFIYSGDITIEPYFAKHTCTGVTADNAKFAYDLMNPGKYTIKTAGFYYGTKPDPVKTGSKITDTVVSSYQTAASIPCTHNLKDEYGIKLNSGTTYYYVLYCYDSNNNRYVSDEYSFTTKSISVSSVAISPGNSSLNIGKTLQLTATVSPSNATNKGVNWSSNNTAVATVSSSGVVTAKAKGTATITATAKDGSGKKASVTITVTCAHNSGYNVDAYVAPTCTKTGLTEGKRCKVCNEVITKQTTIPANGHSEVTDKGKAATCTATGLTDGKHCSVCGTVTVKQTTIPAKGHTEVTDQGKAATCTATGLTDGKHCSVCGTVTVKQTTIPAKGHTEVTDRGYAATCTQDGLTDGKHCSVCGTVTVKQTIIPAQGHDRNELGFCIVCDDFFVSGKCGDNLTWTLDGTQTLTIFGTGEMYDYTYIDRPWEQYKENVVELWIQDGVTSVGDDAFVDMWCLESVVIPKSVSNIGSWAFAANGSLTGIWVDSENPVYCSDSYGVLYNKDKTELLAVPGATKGDYFVADTVTRIAEDAFCCCYDLTSISIPKSVVQIDNWAFATCGYLNGIWVDSDNSKYMSDDTGVLFNKTQTELIAAPGMLTGKYTIPGTVKKIVSSGFYSCYLVSEIVIPDSVTYIAPNVFGYTYISEMIIPKSVVEIDDAAFVGSAVSEIRFEGNAPYFGSDVFWNVGATIYYPSGNPTWTDDVKQNYGGELTWVPYLDKLSNVTISRTIPHTTGNILYWDAVENGDVYQIYRLRSGETSWMLLKNTRSLGYKDETAVAGLKYYYKIVARNGNVKSDIKTTASVGMIRPGAAVTSLDNVTIYKTIGHSTGNILYWNAVANAKLYQVYRLENGQWVLLKNTGSLGYKDETARSGVKYYYKIVARNGDAKSNIATTSSAYATRP